MHGPDPANPHPMEGFPQVCFIKNTIKGPNIEVGDYSYYDDPEDSAGFERNVLYHFPFIGDKLKDVEGFIATLRGDFSGAISGVSARHADGLRWPVELSELGFFGGLVMSAIKRDRGVKDWGHMIEGHGGMLDRLDSVCFAAPVFFHMVRYWWA